jgi:uncharacterized protein YjbI with pentapeptide repeats
MPFKDKIYYAERQFVGERFDDFSLSEAEFEGCVFEKCAFPNARFSDCAFIDCRFLSCDLSGMKTHGCKFMDVQIRDSKAVGIDWTNASPFNLSFGFERSTVDYSVFFGLKIAGFKLERSKAHQANFQEAQLKDASFLGSDLLESKFHETDLTGASFKRSRNYSIDPLRNRLNGAVFSFPEALSLLASMGITVETRDDLEEE